ncbi:hypothetical protein SAMN05421771_0958 [Granulicella pectinivorans]|jgi:hypothetical protein|uniref:Uncharacterized protein n=2 Tax=Granulicella pectinivorans TaxID=474950 RepID=A0A1I6LMK7_9BACT|nr:hypothetical protein SAMN05421771_0958 [Granulicella pectinivorans]
MMLAMKSLFPFRLFDAAPDDADSLSPAPVAVSDPESEPESSLLRTAALISAGVGAVALGVIVGRELRIRYKFKRRTPYDFYAHSGDEQEMEFGVGT